MSYGYILWSRILWRNNDPDQLLNKPLSDSEETLLFQVVRLLLLLFVRSFLLLILVGTFINIRLSLLGCFPVQTGSGSDALLVTVNHIIQQ